MKKRMTKVLALGMMAAMLISAPLSAMAAEAAPADAAATAETQPEMAMQAAEGEAAVTALTNGVDPMTLDGLVPVSYTHLTGIVTAKDETNRTYVCYVTNGRLDTDYTGLAYGTVDGVEGWYNFHDGYNFHEGYLNKGKELVEYNGCLLYTSRCV